MTSKSIFRIIGLISCIAAGQLLAHGQVAPDSKAGEELNRKAQALLFETIPLVRQLKNKDNQVLSRVALAELQWKDQEKSARQLYREAFDVVRQAWANRVPDDESPYDERSLIHLRDRVIESGARRDAAMARQLFEQMRVASPSNAGKSSAETSPSTRSDLAEYDRDLERSLAISAAADNPDETVRLIRKELDSGLSLQITRLLVKLAEKDSQKASSLIGAVVNKFRKINLDTEPEKNELASLLLDLALAGSPGNKENAPPPEKPSIKLTPESAREIVEAVTDMALDDKLKRRPDYLLVSLLEVIDAIEQVAPPQAARLRKKFAELSKENEDARNPYTRFQESSARNEIAGMLEAARQAPAEMRDALYTQVALAAWESGDKAQANEIAEKNIGSSYERNQLLRTFQDKAIADAIKKEDLGQARQLIQQVRSVESRLGQLIDLASAYVAKGDKKAALEILNEAQRLIPASPTNQSELEREIKLANAFSKVDIERSFVLLAAATEQMNDINKAAALVASFNFVPMVSLRDGEFELESHFGVVDLDSILFREIRTLAAADFEKTKRILDKFERPEIRTSVYLHLARTILEPTEDCNCSCPTGPGNPNKAAQKQ